LRQEVEPDQVEGIKRSADRMVRLIDGLLDAATLEAGRLAIHNEPTSVHLLVAEVIEEFEAAATQKSLHLQRHVPDEELAVLCDHDRILQTLSNLIGNSVKFTDRGTITVSVERLGNEAVFSIEDTGRGIPETQLSHVFDRYWQAEETARLG